MTDERDLIRSRIDIADLIGQTVVLKRTGRTFKGLCPFHNDRNPSFTVSPETGRYRCWSCGESGDAFTWLMKTQNVDFLDALRLLAAQAGVILEEKPGRVKAEHKKSDEEIMLAALRYFREALGSHRGAREYCDRRGLDAPTVEAWELGYAPEQGDVLATFLKRQGFSLEECRALFLVDQRDDGSYYDKFRGRLMFPIRNERGQMVAFGGRLLGDGQPKYINSSDTPLFRKGRTLYGLNRAREHLVKQRRLVLAEGYLDVIACHRAGVNRAVASLGTALTEDHAKLIKRWADEVVILYDADDAGRKAAGKAIDLLGAEGLRVEIAVMPSGDDPDTLLKREGPEAVQTIAAKGVSPTEFLLREVERRHEVTDQVFWEESVSVLATTPNEIELDAHLVRLATMYPETRDAIAAQNALRRWVGRVRRQIRQGIAPPSVELARESKPQASKLGAAELVLFAAFCTDEFRVPAWRYVMATHLFSTEAGILLSEAISRTFAQGAPDGPLRSWVHRLESEPAKVMLDEIQEDFRNEAITEDFVADALQKLKHEYQKRQLQALKQEDMSSQDALRRIQEKLQQIKPAFERERVDDGTE